jgi:Flp pilus assembly pilin Flp
MLNLLRKLPNKKKGQGMVEYGLIILLVAELLRQQKKLKI